MFVNKKCSVRKERLGCAHEPLPRWTLSFRRNLTITFKISHLSSQMKRQIFSNYRQIHNNQKISIAVTPVIYLAYHLSLVFQRRSFGNMCSQISYLE